MLHHTNAMLQGELERARLRIDELKAQRDQLFAAEKGFRTENAVLQTKMSALSDQLTNMVRDLTVARAERDALRVERASWEKDRTAAFYKRKLLVEERDAARNAHEAILAERDALRKQLDDLR